MATSLISIKCRTVLRRIPGMRHGLAKLAAARMFR